MEPARRERRAARGLWLSLRLALICARRRETRAEEQHVRIAVVGASGWLGGAVAEQAVQRGHEVIAYQPGDRHGRE